jgi:hypothetical protein
VWANVSWSLRVIENGRAHFMLQRLKPLRLWLSFRANERCGGRMRGHGDRFRKLKPEWSDCADRATVELVVWRTTFS